MQTIPLQQLPAQAFSITLDQNQWSIDVKLVNGNIAFSFTLNGNLLINGIRAVPGYRIIPYDYLQAGNFALLTTAFEIADWTKFGTTQQLVYISQAEIDALPHPFDLSADKPTVTADDFDPNGDLPLRFQPVGYVQA